MNRASGEETNKKKRTGKKADTLFPAHPKENQGVGTDQREELLSTHSRARLYEAKAPDCWR